VVGAAAEEFGAGGRLLLVLVVSIDIFQTIDISLFLESRASWGKAFHPAAYIYVDKTYHVLIHLSYLRKPFPEIGQLLPEPLQPLKRLLLLGSHGLLARQPAIVVDGA
jgi:hypothetical protein